MLKMIIIIVVVSSNYNDTYMTIHALITTTTGFDRYHAMSRGGVVAY